MRSAIILSLLVVAALAAPSRKKPFGSIDFESYWSLDEIYDYMAQLVDDYPGITEMEMMGTSEGGRTIRALRITNEEHLGRETLPVIFVTAGVSARDWVSVMSAVNLMHELTEHHDDFGGIVDNIEWFVIPVANPDGYEFSRTEGNRAWIKNRSVNNGSTCIGTNVERNFAFNWGLNINSNSDPCSDDFRGIGADSEEETKTIQFAVDITRRLQRAYITFKSGSIGAHSLVTYPFSSNNELFMPNFQVQMSIGNIVVDTIWRETGARYRSMSEANAGGLVSGTSGDYAAGIDQIPLVYTFYTPSGGNNGWDNPESEINRIVNEVFVGTRSIADYIATLPLPVNITSY